MKMFIIILLSIIQGATEFLPVSSSGHLVLFYRIFNIETNTIFLSVLLHFATLLSVLWFYRKTLLKLIKNPFCITNINLLISTIITVILAIFLMPTIEKSFNGASLKFCFLISAILLFYSENFAKNKPYTNNFKLSSAIVMGIGQGLACFPGISRSGTTISAGLLAGEKKEDVANYSFLMSIPIICASLLLEIYKFIKNPTVLCFSIFELSVGFTVAFFVGLLCIKIMLKCVKNKNLTWFAFYLVLLSLFLTINDKLLFWF